MEQKIPEIHKNTQEKLDVNIRFAKVDDWQTVRGIRLEALDSPDQKKFIGLHPEWAEVERNRTTEEWKEILSDKDQFIVLTYLDNKLIGSGAGGKNTNEEGTYGIGRAYIRDEKDKDGKSITRHKGLGKKQFAFRINEIIKRGGTRITHGVYIENPEMLELSKSFGFKKISEEPNEYGFYTMELNNIQDPEFIKKIDEVLK